MTGFDTHVATPFRAALVEEVVRVLALGFGAPVGGVVARSDRLSIKKPRAMSNQATAAMMMLRDRFTIYVA